MVASLGTHHARIGAQELELPIIPLTDDLGVALLITVDQGVDFIARAGRELASLLEPLSVDVVASVATMGIPLAIAVSQALGLDDYVIFQKTPKIHLADALAEPLRSITTESPQRLLFDRRRVEVVVGKRVALIDDVISTGGSLRAALALLRRAGGLPVGIGVLATEGDQWQKTIGEDAKLVRALGSLPLFRRISPSEVQPIS